MNVESKMVAVKCCGVVECLDEAHCSHHIAAVDLLESTKEMLKWIGGLPTDCESSDPTDWRAMLDRARAAIKKASV